MKSVLLDESEREEMRRKVTDTDWAPKLVDRLRKSIERDPRQPANYYETIQYYIHTPAFARQARDRALVYAATGEEEPLKPMVDAFRREFRLDAMDQPLDAEPPAELGGINTDRVKNWRPAQWSYNLMRGPYFYAYDLTRHHPVWDRQGLGERLEQRFAEILRIQKPMLAGARGWGNTTTWFAAAGALLGAMLGDDEAVDLAINGPMGFKSILGFLVDGHFWPEPVSYGHHYVSCVLTIVAEVARHTGREDLYRWETSEGVSLKSMYDGLLKLLFAHGRFGANADGGGTSEYANLRREEEFTTWNSPVDRLWNHRHNRNANKFEIAYRAYRDPQYAWVLSQEPERDMWDREFWGYSALTHGVPLGESTPPDATSHVWRCYGASLVRGDETADYWNGNAPAVYLCKGQNQAHGHSDTGSIILNALDRNLYPDLQYKWNYQARIDPETGEDLNPVPYSKTRFAHNTVSVDCGESTGHVPQLGGIRRSGPMKITSISDGAAQMRRTVGVTPEYVFDWVCVGRLAGPEEKPEHTFDYHLHGLGVPELDGVEDLEKYTTLGEEYGMGVIDTRSDAPGNQWIRPGKAGSTDGQWQAIMREERPLDPSEPRGVCIRVLGEQDTKVITGNVPDYVSMEGWDATQPEEGSPSRLGLLVVRRNAPATEFIVVHQPFKGTGPAPMEISRSGDEIQIGGPGFCDTIELPSLVCRRERKSTGSGESMDAGSSSR